MNGYEYEYACAEYLRRKGFSDVRVTKASGDQGADILARRRKITYAIQCKYYAKPVGNKAVQEVYAGATYYGCDRAMVITNQTFTRGARELADSLGVELLPGVNPRRRRFGAAELLATAAVLAMVVLAVAMFARPELLWDIFPETSDERLQVSLGATAVGILAFWAGSRGFGMLLGGIGTAVGITLTGLHGHWKMTAIAVGGLTCAACFLRMLLHNRYAFVRQEPADSERPSAADDEQGEEIYDDVPGEESDGRSEATKLLYETLKLAEASLAAADRETLAQSLAAGEEQDSEAGLHRWEQVIAEDYRFLTEREAELAECGELPSARRERLYGTTEPAEK